jgi:hypothetical protein
MELPRIDMKYGAAAAWAAKEFGGLCRLSLTTVTLTAGQVGPILGADPERVSWGIFNLSASNAYGNFIESVSASSGFPLGASGGTASMNLRDDSVAVIMPVWGFCGSTITLTVVTVRRETK